jgi:hypothetical protein
MRRVQVVVREHVGGSTFSRWLVRRHDRMWDAALVFGGAFVGILVDSLLAKRIAIPERTGMVLGVLGLLCGSFWVLSVLGERRNRVGVSNEELLLAVKNVEAKVDGRLLVARGVPYAAASVAAVGSAGPPSSFPNVVQYGDRLGIQSLADEVP